MNLACKNPLRQITKEVGRPSPPLFFFKIPTFSRFFVADVPKAAKPLAQIDRVHGIPEQIQVSVKGISTLLI